MVTKNKVEPKGAVVNEAMSDNDKRAILQSAVTSSLAIGNRENGPWLRDIYDTELVYEIGGKNYRMSYVIDRKGKVVFGQAELVVPQTVYNVVAEAVEVKIEQLTTLASERENNTAIQQSINKLVELLEKEDLDEKTAEPFLKEADDAIAKLTEATPMKTEDGQQYPQSAFAYSPEADKPSGWKLRLWDDPEKKVTRAQLGRAAAALSPGGFRGQKVAIPSADMAAVKRKIRAEYRKLDVSDEDIPKWVKESDETRNRVFESCEIDIQEVDKGNLAKGILPVRIIKPGFNSSKERYYTENAVRDAAVIFDGAKMYADHPAKGDRPERSMRDWAATLHDTRVSESGNAVGMAHIHAGWLKEMVVNLFENGDLQHLGVSINAVGRGVKQVVEGTKTNVIESLVKSRMQSVDFVTEAGAGGQAGLTESVRDEFIDVELIDLATLREARPDLVKEAETDIRAQIQTEVKAKMELEAQVKELEGQVTTLTAERDALKEAAAQAVKEKAKAEAQALIKEAVDKAELPVAAKTRLIETHKEDESADGIEEVIKAEVDYIASLTEGGKIRDLGPSGDKDPAKTKERMEEGFAELTGSVESGKVAAAGR